MVIYRDNDKTKVNRTEQTNGKPIIKARLG